MITDADIKKLKAVFATKDDLKKLHKDIIKDVADLLANAILPIVNDHEKRLDRLEKHVGGFPNLA